MKTILFPFTVFISFCAVTSCQAQVKQNTRVRQPAVAGSFYPADAVALKAQLDQLFRDVEDKTTGENLAAIIVPHAGYVFSGPVAASAYAKIDPGKYYARVFIIGTSHHVLLNGASVYNQGDYKTPLGIVPVDTDLANQLIDGNRLIQYVAEAHTREHSLEVQLPFLQHQLKKPFKIVPIIIGTQSAETCKKLAEILKPYFTTDNLFVISSDFSHYPAYGDACKNDQATEQAIAGNSPAKFMQTISANGKKNIGGLVTSCCGWSSVLTLLNITSEQQDIMVNHVKYMNSGDSPYGDRNRVVGYHAFVFDREKPATAAQEIVLAAEDKEMLLKIAREAIDMKLKNTSAPKPQDSDLPANLKLMCGAFVTLTQDGHLRGCIGRFTSDEPLYKVVQEMAVAAAFNDTRFFPVTKKDLYALDIEISVLTPLQRIYSIDEFKLGEQGIYMIKGSRSGTFLPKVAESTHWTKEEFLGHCAEDKAGIGWEGWKDAELYTYEALIFDEKELLSPEK